MKVKKREMTGLLEERPKKRERESVKYREKKMSLKPRYYAGEKRGR